MQPFAAVTVTEKLPLVVTLSTGPVAAVFHKKVPPVALLVAVRFICEIVQFSSGFAGEIAIVGSPKFSETTTDALDVHPFAPVAVTENVPAAVAIWVFVKLPLPQLNVAAGSPLDAVSVAVGAVQVKMTAAGAIVAPGGVVFCEILEVAVAVHPLAGFVTVTVKLPAAETVFVCEKLPPPQLKVAPGVVDPASKLMVVVLHEIVPEAGLTVAFGWVKFWVIATFPTAVQPPAAVAVTV